jgi:hypothetical protein
MKIPQPRLGYQMLFANSWVRYNNYWDKEILAQFVDSVNNQQR